MKYKAVIFDNDGVLVQSLDAHWLSYCEALGRGLDRMEILTREGLRSEEMIRQITGLEGQALKDAVARKVSSFNKLRKNLAADKDAIKVIREVKKRGLKVAVATGTTRENMTVEFGKDLSLFDAIVTAEDYDQPKPSPQPYLLAAKRLGLRPDECIAVDNAPWGIKSAKAAKMFCLGLTSTLPEEYLREADKIIYSIEGVLEWI